MLKFGTSGIRDLTENLLKNHVAKELAEKLSALGWQTVIVARDGRTGSDKLLAEFTKHFTGTVHDIGITTTPELAAQNGLAVMITASHNPSRYCGFKVFLNHFEQSTLDLPPVPAYNRWDELPRDIVIDCANGALGHKLHSLEFTNIINYSGEINHQAGVMYRVALTQHCQQNNLEIGFAVDGDADRFMMYLGNRILSSEEVTLLIGRLLNLSTIVVDETMNSGLAKNFNLVHSAVGGESVIRAMRANRINFGAEKSGHYYLDMNIGISDAVDAMILISKAYHEKGLAGFQAILRTYRPVFQFDYSIKLEDLPANYDDALQQFVLPKGIRKIIRKSGTEPLLRITLEGKNKNAVHKVWLALGAALNLPTEVINSGNLSFL